MLVCLNGVGIGVGEPNVSTQRVPAGGNNPSAVFQPQYFEALCELIQTSKGNTCFSGEVVPLSISVKLLSPAVHYMPARSLPVASFHADWLLDASRCPRVFIL